MNWEGSVAPGNETEERLRMLAFRQPAGSDHAFTVYHLLC